MAGLIERVLSWKDFMPIVRRSRKPPLSEDQEVFLSTALFDTVDRRVFFDVTDGESDEVNQLTIPEMYLAQQGQQDTTLFRVHGHRCLLMSSVFLGYLQRRGISRSYYLAQGSAMYWNYGIHVGQPEVRKSFLRNSADFDKLSDRLVNAELIGTEKKGEVVYLFGKHH